MSEDTYSYFRLCLGESYKSTYYGQHEGIHPTRVREAMAALAGRPEADVIAALVKQHDVDRNCYDRLLAEHVTLMKSKEIK